MKQPSNYLIVVENISEYVISLFNKYGNGDLYYHNLEHTKSVVIRAFEIAANYSFSETEIFILLASAWFHDTGHLTGSPLLHEERSVMIMQDFLKTQEVEKEIIDKIKGCICATKVPQNPKSLLEEIVCDADTYNLGTEEFIKTDKLLKKELQAKDIAVDNWEAKTLKMLLSHKHFTPFCQALLNEGKERNVGLVQHTLQVNDKNKTT